jgi:hypothetical protein
VPVAFSRIARPFRWFYLYSFLSFFNFPVIHSCLLCWLSPTLIFYWCQTVCLFTHINVPTMYRTLLNKTPAKYISLITPSI